MDLLLLLVVLVHPALQCSVDNLPPFGSTADRDTPGRDRFQAIVPAYTFQCSGRVTEWKACVQPGSNTDDLYYIQFQVWRPSGGDGCYSLVGFNRPLDEDGEEGVLSSPGNTGDPLGRCVELPVAEDQQIEVQSGDVVGYYVDRFRDGRDEDDGGIQWIQDHNNVVVYYEDNIPREQRKSNYAIGGPNPTECGFPISGDSNSYSLADSIAAAPIISLTIVTAAATPTTSVSLSTPEPPGIVPTTVSRSTTGTTSTDSTRTTSSDSTTGTTGSGSTSTLTVNPSPSNSPSCPSDMACADSPETGSRVMGVAVGAAVSVLVFIVSVCVVLVLLFVRQRRRRSSKLTANVAYNIHNHWNKTEACEAYQTVESDVVETTNPAYATTSGEELYIYTSTNEAYTATDVSTSENVAYGTNMTPIICSKSEEGEVCVGANEAYTATDVSTSDNVAYGINIPITDSKSEEGEVDVGANEAYMPTVIPTADNPAYGPVEGNDDSTLNYDYVTT